MSNLTERTSPLREHLVYTIQKIDKLVYGAKCDIKQLIVDCVGLNKPMVFSDEIGYPSYADDSEPINASVCAIRVTGEEETMTNFVLEFNCVYPEANPEAFEEGWFNPDNYGEYDIADLLENVINWIETRKD